MSTDLYVLPTRIDGSLGRNKRNPESPIALDYQVDAPEYETIADWMKELVALIGAKGTTDPETVRVVLGQHVDQRFLDLREFGLGAALHPMWDAGGLALPTIATGPGAGLVFKLDADTLASIPGDHFRAAQSQGWAFDAVLTADPGGVWHAWLGFVDGATSNEGYGVVFSPGGAVNGFTRTAGVNTLTAAGAWVAGVRVDIEARISGGHLFVSVDGGAEVDCGAVVANAVSYWMMSAIGGVAGKTMTIRRHRLTAHMGA